MRRRAKKDILVKDFVDNETKLAMAKAAVGGDPDYVTPKTVTTKQEILDYLAEARSLTEIQQRFDYASLNSAYFAVYKLMKDLKVQSLGHGLYVSTNAGVKTFNVQGLSEQELQKRGLEAYQNKINAEKTKAIAKGTTDSRFKKHVTIKSVNARMDAIVAFCATPHTAIEIAERFGYTSSASANEMLRKLGYSGELDVVSKRHGQYLYQSGEIIKPKKLVEKAPKAELSTDEFETMLEMPQPETPALPVPRLLSSNDLQQLAMRYLWESETLTGYSTNTPEKILKAFVKWANEQEGK